MKKFYLVQRNNLGFVFCRSSFIEQLQRSKKEWIRKRPDMVGLLIIIGKTKRRVNV